MSSKSLRTVRYRRGVGRPPPTGPAAPPPPQSRRPSPQPPDSPPPRGPKVNPIENPLWTQNPPGGGGGRAPLGGDPRLYLPQAPPSNSSPRSTPDSPPAPGPSAAK